MWRFCAGHGASGHVVVASGDYVPHKTLFTHFDGAHCPALAGRLKAFVLDCCRGPQQLRAKGAADAPADAPVDAPVDSQADAPVGVSGPAADLLVMYATVDEYVAYGDDAKGSLLVSTLCDLLRDPHSASARQGVVQLAMAANRVLQERFGGRQVSEVSHRLTADVCLRPAAMLPSE